MSLEPTIYGPETPGGGAGGRPGLRRLAAPRPATIRQYRAHPELAELVAGATPSNARSFPMGSLLDPGLLVTPLGELAVGAVITLDSTLEPVLLACNTCPLSFS